MRLAEIDNIARRQHGVVHRRQTSWSRSAWYRALDQGVLLPMHPSVGRLVGTTRGEIQRISAATLAVPDSIASHRSAAVLWGFAPEAADAAVHVSTPNNTARRDRLVGVTCHRPDDRHDVRVVVRRRLPATPPVRTLVDLGITDPHLVSAAVGRALSTGLVTLAGLEAGLDRHARQGRHGVVALRRAIDEWAIDACPADSVLEVAFARLCDVFGLPAVAHHQRIEGWEVDFRFVGTPVIVECDGWATHGRERQQFELDRRKDDDLRAAGWVPMRITYRAIVHRPADTARRLRRTLERWSTAFVPDAA